MIGDDNNKRAMYFHTVVPIIEKCHDQSSKLCKLSWKFFSFVITKLSHPYINMYLKIKCDDHPGSKCSRQPLKGIANSKDYLGILTLNVLTPTSTLHFLTLVMTQKKSHNQYPYTNSSISPLSTYTYPLYWLWNNRTMYFYTVVTII